jgi:hypothetical protein
MLSSCKKSMRYTEHGIMYIDLILAIRNKYCRGSVIGMIHILVANLWMDLVISFVVLTKTFCRVALEFTRLLSTLYQKKEWRPHPSPIGLTRLNSKLLHPVGRRVIDERKAKLFNTHIMSNRQWMSVTIKAGDKVCQTCFNNLPELMRTCLDAEPVLVETPEAKHPEFPTLDEQLKRDSAKEELNRVFQVLKMKTIRDEYVDSGYLLEKRDLF